MPYLIDGHNLIPKIPGLSLQALDDEERLIELLQVFCRVERKRAEVYFDNAPPGQAGSRRYGQVMAYYVRRGQTADAAITQRLKRLGKDAHNWSVVSSDNAVQAEARAGRAQVISSDAFARRLLAGQERAPGDAVGFRPEAINSDEVDDWLKLFGEGKDGKR